MTHYVFLIYRQFQRDQAHQKRNQSWDSLRFVKGNPLKKVGKFPESVMSQFHSLRFPRDAKCLFLRPNPLGVSALPHLVSIPLHFGNRLSQRLMVEHAPHFHVVEFSNGIRESRTWTETAPNAASFLSSNLVSVCLRANAGIRRRIHAQVSYPCANLVTRSPRMKVLFPRKIKVFRSPKRKF